MATQSLEKLRATVLLRDGATLLLRPLEPNDEERIAALFQRLGPGTVWTTAYGSLSQLSRDEVRRFCAVDYQASLALVATLRENADERVIAVGRFDRLASPDSAEVVFVVEDAYKGKGIGTQLLEHLAGLARMNSIHSFTCEVPVENKDMLLVFKDSGFGVEEEVAQGMHRMTVHLAPTVTFQQKSIERESAATVESLKAFLKPRSVAVVGASRREETVGHKLFRNLLINGYKGIAYPVNPNAESVAAVRTYPSVLEIPGNVDMAVVMVPAPAVEAVVEECGRKGVRALVIISAGFGEIGHEGLEQQHRLLEIAGSYGMRIIGPNCMGVLNTDPGVSMNATFSSIFPPSGTVAFCSQSGAVGLAILEYAQSLKIGLSSFVSIGNRADVSSNDLLQYWHEDPSTDIILLYMESFGNPRKFARIARTVSAIKPIVAVKSGRTAAGSRAAASHTGALASGEMAVAALFKQAGMIRVDSLEELFDVANLLTHQPIPRGRRVAILTNGGGPGIMTADACAGRNLELPDLSPKTIEELRSFLPIRASVANPIDTTADAGAGAYGRALDLLAEDENIDNVIVIFVPPIITDPAEVAAAIRDAAPKMRQKGKVLMASFMSAHGAPAELQSGEGGIVPSFPFPEDTATALGRACDYSEWLRRPVGCIPKLDGIDREKGKAIVEAAMEATTNRPVWLSATAINDLMEAYGIRTVQARTAADAQEAARVAEELGFPVAIKLLSDTIVHKTEVGGVVLDLDSRERVESSVKGIRDRLTAMGRVEEMQGITVQQMIKGGAEVIIGVTQDPAFGPLILFGMGGIYTELIKDITFRIHPLTDVDAHEMIRSVNAYKLLTGFRGSEPSDSRAIEDLLLRISAMVEDLPQVRELDLNPVKALPEGYVVVDARILLDEAQEPATE